MIRVARRSMLALSAVAVIAGSSSCQLFRRASDTSAEPSRRAPSAGAVTTSASFFSALQNRYGGSWYRTLTFTGENTRWDTQGRATRNRFAEYVSVPGRLRIEFLPWSNRSGVLFESGRVHVFDNGQLLDSRSQRHPVLLLTADIYAMPSESALSALRDLGVATQRFRQTTWQRRPIYVIGAERGDTTSTQVWFDAETFIPLRWIQSERTGGQLTVGDTRFLNYRRVGGYPIPHEIMGYRDGRRALREVYSGVRVNPQLSAQLFDPARWRDAPRPSN